MTEKKRKQIEYHVANEFLVDLLFAISKKYHISEARVVDIFDALNYWNVINDDRVCCVAAHDGVEAVIRELDEKINEVLLKEDRLLDINRFESRTVIIIMENLMQENKLSREQAIKDWFNSKTYSEMIRRNLTFISGTRAYDELKLERENSPNWMVKEFE